MQEDKKITVLLLCITSFLILSYLHSILRMIFIEKNFCDFAHYYFYLQQITIGKNIYNLTKEEILLAVQLSDIPVHICLGRTGAVYSPLFYAVISPLTNLKFSPANIVWLVLNNLLLISFLLLWAAIVKKKDNYTILGYLIVMFASQPLLENIGIGQANIIILFLLILTAYFYNYKNTYFCGPFLAFVLLMKPQFGLIWLYFLWKKDNAASASTVASYLIFRLLGILLYGFDVEISYWNQLIFSDIGGALSTGDINLIGLKSLLERIFLGAAPAQMKIAYMLYILAALLLAFYTFRHIPRTNNSIDFLKEYSIIICLILIISPVTEEHHLVVAYIPFFTALDRINGRPSSNILITTAFSLVSVRYSLASFSFFHSGFSAIFTSGKILGVFILWLFLHNHKHLTENNRNGI